MTMNPFAELSYTLRGSTLAAMYNATEAAAEAMKDRLVANGHIDTGATRDSVSFSVEETPDHGAVGTITGSQVWDWLSRGTGKFRPGGRQTPWTYYKESRGQFYTTSGMEPDPSMIDAAVDEALRIFPDAVFNRI